LADRHETGPFKNPKDGESRRKTAKDAETRRKMAKDDELRSRSSTVTDHQKLNF